MARAFNGKRPDNLGHTLRTLFSYLGRHKGMIALVGVLAADASLFGDDFKCQERTFSLITQVVGRSGRGEKHGRAMIQTYVPDNPVIEQAA